MIARSVKIKVLAFIVVSIVGIAYVAIRYVGVGDLVLNESYPISADFSDAGGIYQNASVTYRGTPIGKVTGVHLTDDGVRVGMRIDRGFRVPANLTAVVTDRSAVGEQYLDLRPNTDSGPFLKPDAVIPASRTSTPLPVETLLVNLDKLVGSVNTEDLQSVIDELGVAFQGSEGSLQRILDSGDAVLNTADQYLPQTLQLIEDGQTVLETQRVSASAIQRWAQGLAQLTTTLRTSDPDLRALLQNAPPAAQQVDTLLRNINPNIGTLLGNLISVTGVATRRIPGIQQILVEYPLVVAGGFTVTPGDGTAHFGLVVNLDDPAPCQYIRTGTTLKCTNSEQAQGSSVRGTNNVPGPTGPEITPVPEGSSDWANGSSSSSSSSGSSGQSANSNLAGYDPTTGLVLGPDGQPLQFGSTGGQYQLAGDQSWKQLLLAGLEP